MKWVWELKDWPKFSFDLSTIAQIEEKFWYNAGLLKGLVMHLETDDGDDLKASILSLEAIFTSKIEGEIFNRDSVLSSVKKHLGLKTKNIKVTASEYGAAEMQVDLFKNYQVPLSETMLWAWHEMLMNGRRDLQAIGQYRTHPEPMQIISGNFNKSTMFYEAPPSSGLNMEMNRYIDWYRQANEDKFLPAVVFAAVAHIYFELIHPFEDGNGRIGRALAEKAIALRTQNPLPISLSKVIEQRKKHYYESFAKANHSLDLSIYVQDFSDFIIQGQEFSIKTIEFTLKKAKFLRKYELNSRQEKVVLRVFEEGFEGFKGGLSAANYRAISDTSLATTTRDLTELVAIGAFTKSGQLKGTRYALNMEGLI